MPSMTRRAKSGRADRRAEIERRLRTALEALVERGETFTELSVERLVVEAGMSRSTFYVYFEDKSALLRALESAAMRELYAGGRQWIDKGAGATRTDIRDAMRGMLDKFCSEQVVLVAVAETAVYDADIRGDYRAAVEDFARTVKRLITEGQKDGRVRDVAPAETAAALAWMIERTIYQEAPGAKPKELDGIAEGLADVIWNTLYQ